MAEDRGKFSESTNQADEEASLGEATARESLHSPHLNEEHFKQNIMMGVEETPHDVKSSNPLFQEESNDAEAPQNATESVNEAQPDNAIDSVRDGNQYDSHYAEKRLNSDEESAGPGEKENINPAYAAMDSSNNVLSNQTDVFTKETGNSAQDAAVFNQPDIDQVIEEAVYLAEKQDQYDISAVKDADGSSNQVSEAAAKGTSVGITAFASDADGTNNEVSYSLSDDANGAFGIDASTGEVFVLDASQLDFESAEAMKIEVTATSEDGSSSSEVFKIAVNDANEFAVSAVKDADGSSNQVSEAAAKGTSVGITAFASDADGTNNEVSYSLSDDANGAFGIDASTGEVFVLDASQLDFESAEAMKIEVTATSEDGSSSSEVFDISIDDVNEGASVITSTVKGDEDTAIPLNIQFADVEPGAVVTVTIGDVPGGAVLSAGIDNGDGSWSLEQSEISGLTITPPENSSTDFTLNIDTKVEENGEVVEYNNTIDVVVDAVADAPSIIGPEEIVHLQNSSFGFENGLDNVDTLGVVNNVKSFQGQSATEGSSMAQLFSGGARDSNIESELGLAKGTLDSLSGGNSTDGSSMQTAIAVKAGDVVTVDWNFYNGETSNYIKQGFNDSAIITVNGKAESLAQSSDVGKVGVTGWQTYTYEVTEDGVLDLGFAVTNTNDQQYDSSLLVDNILINGNAVDLTPVDLNLNIDLTDTDGSESVMIEISGVPADAALNTGVALGGGVWSVDSADINDVQLVPSATTSGTVSLTVTAIATETEGGDTSSTSHTIDVTFDSLDSVIMGSAGDDNIDGDESNDVISAKDGADVVSGGDGNDYISGGEGDDQIKGDAGNDQLFGGAGDDQLEGGDGDDILSGDAGNDALYGGNGSDIFVFDIGLGNDYVDGGGGAGWVDTIDLSDYAKDAVDVSSPWQIEVDGMAVDYEIDAGLLELGEDVSGVIQFDDGSQLSFDNIENIEW